MPFQIGDGSVVWEPVITQAQGEFITVGTVATVIDQFREFTVDPASGNFVTDLIIPVPPWAPKRKTFAGDSVQPHTPIGLRAVALTNGKTGTNEPDWPTTEGEVVDDGNPDLDEGETQLTWRMVQDRWYQHGVLRFTSGANAGYPRGFEVADYEVVDETTLRFRLVFALPYPLEGGETFEVEAGCDKTLPTCIYKFANAVNFGGEPFVQGFDSANDYPTDDI